MAGWFAKLAGISVGTGLLALTVPLLIGHAPRAVVDLRPSSLLGSIFASPNEQPTGPPAPFTCQPQSYTTQIVSLDPLVIYIHRFLSPADIAGLLAAGEGLFKPSTVNKRGGNQGTPDRTSWSAGLPRDDAAVDCVLARARGFMGTMLAPGRDEIGPPQLVRYTAGQRFNVHHDWFPRPVASYDGRDATFNRVASFFAILQDDCVGGETHFPYIAAVETQERAPDRGAVPWREHEKGGLAFPPVAGNALFWVNLFANGTGDKRVMHAGLPVKDGLKTAMNIWPRVYDGPDAWNWPEKS